MLKIGMIVGMIVERKERDHLAAVSPNFNQTLGSLPRFLALDECEQIGIHLVF